MSYEVFLFGFFQQVIWINYENIAYCMHSYLRIFIIFFLQIYGDIWKTPEQNNRKMLAIGLLGEHFYNLFAIANY